MLQRKRQADRRTIREVKKESFTDVEKGRKRHCDLRREMQWQRKTKKKDTQ